ncbi:MAG TPA: xanthine dehydrogenase family protein molybdopterin-binding subunit [Methylomirabilota bacterium]|nr:xanthine dehydrogenase family protein molybdopterin-binding subunit [Methylomirabilota bacterium]
MDTPFGRPQRRKEDQRFLTGRGRYVDDLRAPGALHAAFVRSPHAHARVERIDVAAARGMPGVSAVYTLADLPECRRPIPPAYAAPPGFRPWAQPVFAEPLVRHAGEVLAVALADSPARAADAAEMVSVDYVPLPAVADLGAATAAGAPRVYAEWADNDAGLSDATVGDPAAALAGAAVVVEADLALAKVAGAPLEPRGILVVPDGADGRFTVWIPTQGPYALRSVLAAAVALPEEQVRIVCTDSGGGFGIKGHAYPEDVILAVVAKRLGRAVRWMETRREHFLMGAPDRGQRHRARLGVDGDGRIVALETRFARDHGAYVTLGEVITRNTINHLPGPYRVPNLLASGRNVVTHTLGSGAYRGSGRPEAAFVRECLLDRAARRLGLDPAEIRRRNLVRPGEMPHLTGLIYRDGTPASYDPADFPASFERLLEAFGYADWRKRAQGTRGGRRPLGVGLACYVQATGVGPFEGADVRVDGTGAVHVFIGVSSQGQAHETTMAQIAAAELGVDPDRVTVSAGDTATLPFGNGTGGSRVAANSGPAVAKSSREVADKARRVAAEMLECAPADVVLAGGRAHVAGMPQRGLALGEVARAALRSKSLVREGQPGLQVCGYFAPETVTFAFGAQACAVEVDVETGALKILRLVATHDCGRAINPLVVEGQLHGGIVQGIGTALGEELVHDADGQLVTGSFMDYAMPAAADVPALETFTVSYPSTRNDLGIKGVGESGIIAPPAAIVNAVEDALADRGVVLAQVPVTRARVWEALAGARRA